MDTHTPEADLHTQRRRFARVLFDTPASLALDDGQAFPCRLIDIALKGALIETDTATLTLAGQPLSLRIGLGGDREDGSQRTIVMRVAVAHRHDQRIGLTCHSIDLDSITELRRLIELNVGDAALLERELSALGEPGHDL